MSVRDRPYVLFCVVIIAVWLGAWLLAFPNLYGWLTDDAMTFDRIRLYESGGRHILDVPWFHAYMWFVMLFPSQFHWSVPSHLAPRAWDQTGHFRALILYTIMLHAILLLMLAYFFRALCSNRFVCAAALLLFAVSPTFLLYADLLDSRYLGYLVGIPAMVLLLRGAQRASKTLSAKDLVFSYAFSGLLIGIAEDIHYECLYLIAPFCLVYWGMRLVSNPRGVLTWAYLLAFCIGVLAWILPVQLISLHYQPFVASYLGMMLQQRAGHISPYSWAENMRTWGDVLIREMGLPLLVAVIAGGWILADDRLRPAYIARFNARLMVWTLIVVAIYLVLSPTFPFFRMLSGLQFFMLLMAMVAVDRLMHGLHAVRPVWRYGIGALLIFGIAFVPTVLRSPEVFAAQQGLGRAVNLAYNLSGPGRVHYIATFYGDTNPKAIVSRRDFEHLLPSDYVVTDDPIFFHVRYPDLFALIYDTKPIVSFPTLWCTQEVWNEVGDFFGFRHWYDEPPNCQSQVFRAADILHAAEGPPLVITSVTADSMARPSMSPDRALSLRDAKELPSDDNMMWRYNFEDLWVSVSVPGPHWLEVDFAAPAKIGSVTVVPPDFRVPPDYLWYGRKRIENMRIYGSTPARSSWRLLWSGSNLEDQVIFTATFRPALVTRLRFVMIQTGPPGNHAVGIEYLRFPGYRQIVRLGRRR